MFIELLSSHACHGGVQRFYRHESGHVGLPMRFSVFLPPADKIAEAGGRVPALVYLAGLTCTEETFAIKAGAQRLAAEAGLALIAPDTSPRGANVPGETDSWDLGVGAGFYLDATQRPWAAHYRMESYIVRDLLGLIGPECAELPIDPDRIGLFGHSMGGHGALVLALRHPGVFRSVSAFAPICAPMDCPWGRKAFTAYLGDDPLLWASHDASRLMASQSAAPHPAGIVVASQGGKADSRAPFPAGILIDQGLDDKFLAEQLHPHQFEAACAHVGQPLTLRRHAGYDHGYYFIQSFMADHIAHHARQLGAD